MTKGTDKPGAIRMGTPQGRGVLSAMILGSGISFLDGLIVVNALPKMDKNLHLGVSGLQWTVSGYLLTLSALLLLGGSLGDLYGRRKIYLTGLFGFVACSMLCGLAPNATVLIIGRLAQGVGGALMIPVSLAVIQAVFHEDDRGEAIGAWTGGSAVFTALGPAFAGVFITYVSWRVAFFINLPLGLLAWYQTVKWVPENKNEGAHHRPDFPGAILAALGLGGITYWAIQGPAPNQGYVPVTCGLVGIALLFSFVYTEAEVRFPMMPLGMYKSHQFNWINICTVIFYGGFGVGLTFMGVRLQTDLGYSPLLAGFSGFPVTIMMFTLSAKFGALGQRIGAKIPMTVGPGLVALGLAMMAGIHPGRSYWFYVLPCVLVWGLGLAITVAPLTTAALAAADQKHVGVASALNNAASRIGQSLTIALVPVLAGMGGAGSLSGPGFQDGYPRGMYISAVTCAVGAAIALLFVNGSSKKLPAPAANSAA